MTTDWNGRALVDTDWLAAHLEDENLRIVDASVVMTRTDEGAWKPSSGRGSYEGGHIPGTQFIDLLTEVQDKSSGLNFTLPGAEDFAKDMAGRGIGDDHMVVVYATAVPWWATRFWWMLRANGHDQVAVLDGGLDKWRKEGRTISTEATVHPGAKFTANRRPELIADKDDVQTMLTSRNGAVINALSRQLFTGESDLGYGRPGRIAGSVLLSSLGLIDQDNGTYLPEDALRQTVQDGLGDLGGEAICYCGGGIAATMAALVLDLLGYDKVSVYDASLQEWAADESLPMETG
ncbi:MAG: sulfurtransferase [Rhodospirillaceae bacterium]|nr:sulfurtransferase [Rhodospirillaceae bacterium]